MLLLILSTSGSQNIHGQSAHSESRIRWLFAPQQSPVQDVHDVESTLANTNAWEGVVTNSHDPFLVLSPLQVDADVEKILYLHMAADAGRQLQVFFSSADPFREEQSVRVRGLVLGSEPALHAIDLRKVVQWRGKITSLRVDLEGSRNGAHVKLIRVGMGMSRILSNAAPLVAESDSDPCGTNRRRNAAFQDTIVATDECHALSAVMTFVKTHMSYVELNALVRLLARVEVEGRQFDAATVARDMKVEDFPGGVRARYKLAGSQITSEIMPLRIGRDTLAQDGAAVFTIRAEPPLPLVVDCGGSMVEKPFSGPFASTEPTMENSADQIILESGLAFIKSKVHPLHVVVRGDGAPSVQTNLTGGQYLRFRAASGQMSILVSYAEDAEQVGRIARTDLLRGRQDVLDYYTDLLQASVRTPVNSINASFRTALYNLEYAWNLPFGWTESINFWHALWHMQHTAGEEWIGHADRSRICNITHAENLMPDGAVPQLMQYANKRRDFGGSNQYFAWQVRHYFQFTGDLEFARQIAPSLDRVIAQSFRENDPDGNWLLGWGQQIGNQEDYISTPHDGTSPSIEGINMFRTRRELALALGEDATVARCDARIRQIEAGLREQLWLGDLGRFAFFRDPLGELRLDGQYHTFLYPVLWDIADGPDSYAMLRHVRDRLTGKDGEVFCSDNFPTHVVSTTGVQSGVAQQPWAAWALAAAGRRNEVYRSLKATADWVMNDIHRGAWPEISTEPTPAYFSPPIGLWIASTVEALFGLKVDKAGGRLRVAPCFPDDWPSAALNLPDYQAEFTRSGDTMEYLVRSREALVRQVRWSLPPGKVSHVSVDGKPVKYRLEPGVECMFLVLETKSSRESRIRVKVMPVKFDVRAPSSVAEGDSLEVLLSGFVLEGIDDRCGVLAEATITGGQRLQARVRTGLLDAYRGYGRLGQMTFSRRTFFLKAKGPGDVRCWLPVDLAILPCTEGAPVDRLRLTSDGVQAKVLVRNNSSRAITGQAWLQIARGEFSGPVNLAPRSQGEVRFEVPARHAGFLSLGDNSARLVLPNQAAMDVTFDGTRLLMEQEALRRYQEARLRPIELPKDGLIPDVQWNSLRTFKAYVHGPWLGLRPPLEAIANQPEVSVAGLEAVKIKLQSRQFVPISFASGRPTWNLSLSNLTCKKLYLLVIPFLDNHDVYSSVARVVVEASDGVVMSRTLQVPGDLDFWGPPAIVGEFATWRQPRTERFGLLPLLSPTQGDWAEGHPPVFPQTAYWASCRELPLSSSILNVVEMDLRRPRLLKSLTVSTLGTAPALLRVIPASMLSKSPATPVSKLN